MKKLPLYLLLLLPLFPFANQQSTQPNPLPSETLSPKAIQVAEWAAQTYHREAIQSLADMVAFKTVADPAVAYADHPEFLKFRRWLNQQCQQLGLTYQDLGYVQRISIGQGEKILGLITHGDVQPANPGKWQKSPFSLDTQSEPGRLIGRGTEDDKGPIAASLYALKAIKDQQIPLRGQVELLIYMAEESDWDPLKAFLKDYSPAPMNIALDAEYPVVTAEKAWSHIDLHFGSAENRLTGHPSPSAHQTRQQPYLVSIKGGEFRSQIPGDAIAEARFLTQQQTAQIRQALAKYPVRFETTRVGDSLFISVQGKAAHSSKPEDGINAVAILAAALATIDWQTSAASDAVYYLNDLVGTGIYGEKYGSVAYRHDFMGPMTLVPTLVKRTTEGDLSVFVNIRRPLGKPAEQLKREIEQALTQWQTQRNPSLISQEIYIGEPMWVKNAPQVPALLRVFEHFTQTRDPQPIAIGGSTNAKLFPNAVSFGPSMPGTEYTGHSEHEFMTEEQFLLTIKMYTAAIIEIAGKQ